MYLPHEAHGQGLVEYALILIFVAIVVIVIVAVYGTSVANYFSQVTTAIPR
jgi:pilus assembly protein Flp/PilA